MGACSTTTGQTHSPTYPGFYDVECAGTGCAIICWRGGWVIVRHCLLAVRHRLLAAKTVFTVLLGLERRRVCDGILQWSRKNCWIEHIRLLRNAPRLPGGVSRVEGAGLFRRAIIGRSRIEGACFVRHVVRSLGVGGVEGVRFFWGRARWGIEGALLRRRAVSSPRGELRSAIDELGRGIYGGCFERSRWRVEDGSFRRRVSSSGVEDASFDWSFFGMIEICVFGTAIWNLIGSVFAT